MLKHKPSLYNCVRQRSFYMHLLRDFVHLEFLSAIRCHVLPAFIISYLFDVFVRTSIAQRVTVFVVAAICAFF